MKKISYLIVSLFMIACMEKGKSETTTDKVNIQESVALKCMSDKFQEIKAKNRSLTKEEQLAIIKDFARIKIQCRPSESEWSGFLTKLEKGE